MIKKTVRFSTHKGGKAGRWDLCSNDAQNSHLNLYTYYADGTAMCAPCVHPDDARALRDALLEIYPLEAPASKPRYEVGVNCFGASVLFKTETVTREIAEVYGPTEEAQDIADALNKAEGA
jgi:hypothetical protein